MFGFGVGRTFLALATLALLAYGVLLASRYLGRLASYPYQVESREENQVYTAQALRHGLDPWSPAEAPRFYNPHGILYAWTAARLLPADALDVRRCRCLSLAALLLAALLVGLAAARLSGSGPVVGAGAGLAALGGYLFYVIPTARVDAFASLFFIAPLALYALFGGGRRDAVWLVFCAGLATLAFLVKPYAAFSGFLLGLVLLAQGRARAGLWVWTGWALALAAAALAVERIFPGYLEGTVFLQARAVGYDWSYLLLQCRIYGVQAALPLGLGLGALFFHPPPLRRTLAWILPALGTFLLLLWMGLNPGNFLIYFFELLHPCLFLAVAALWAGRDLELPWLGLGLACCAVVNVRFGAFDEHRFAHAPLAAVWTPAVDLARSARHPLLPPLMDGVAAGLGDLAFDNGNLEFLDDAVGPAAAALRDSGRSWTTLWARDLRERRVDLVVMDPANPPFRVPLPAGYALVGRLVLPEPVDLGRGVRIYDVYRPRSASGPNPRASAPPRSPPEPAVPGRGARPGGRV